MKKALISLFLVLFTLCLSGCDITPKGPGSEQPYGDYDNEKLYSMYPLYALQGEDGPKFGINHTFKDGVFSSIEDLEYIKCESLASLFNCHFTDEYLKENFKALFFTREEAFGNKSLSNVSYYDLFIENGQIYVTLSYNDYQEVEEETTKCFSELILIPKEWESKITKTSNYEINYNVVYNNLSIKNKYIMSYARKQEFKDAYRKQVLYKIFNDCKYREIYILDAYGEYNSCLVATVTYEGYVHTDVEISVTETFNDISISYDEHYPIYVYYNGKLYSLTEAYNNGYLKIDDIRDIAKKANNWHYQN